MAFQEYDGSGGSTVMDTFTVPTGVTSITVYCYGAGAISGNGADPGLDDPRGGGGGGGGGFRTATIPTTPGTNYAISIDPTGRSDFGSGLVYAEAGQPGGDGDDGVDGTGGAGGGGGGSASGITGNDGAAGGAASGTSGGNGGDCGNDGGGTGGLTAGSGPGGPGGAPSDFAGQGGQFGGGEGGVGVSGSHTQPGIGGIVITWADHVIYLDQQQVFRGRRSKSVPY